MNDTKYPQALRHLCFLLGLFVAFYGCQFNNSSNNHLTFKPALHYDYNYELHKTTAQQWVYNNQNNISYDTINIKFTLQNIKDSDTIHLCRLLFNDFVIKRPPFKITITGDDKGKSLLPRNPFVILDSLRYYLHGLSVLVYINKHGIIKQVNGCDELMKTVAKQADSSPQDAENLLADYLSAEAIKDLLNRIFCMPPTDISVDTNEQWGREITLVTKAPVKLDNLFTLNKKLADTAYVSINAAIFARKSEGDIAYLKGNLTGTTTIDISTGMPYMYQTKSETKTTTDAYIINSKEDFTLFRLN